MRGQEGHKPWSAIPYLIIAGVIMFMIFWIVLKSESEAGRSAVVQGVKNALEGLIARMKQ
jgi:hypothetical protein